MKVPAVPVSWLVFLNFKRPAFTYVNAHKRTVKFILYIYVTSKVTAFLRHAA